MARTRTLYTATLLAAAALSGGCSSSDGTTVLPSAPVYQEIGPFAATDSLAPVKKNGKWGFIDANGILAIGANYSRVLPFSEGLAGVDATGLWGFINTSGAVVIPPKFSKVSSFSESLAVARNRSKDMFGFINKQGGFAIQPQFERALPFSQGLAPVYKGGKWIYVNTSGATVLTTNHYRAYRFTADGLALVRPEQNGKYGFMATDGTLKLPAIYDEAFEFSNGLAPVRFGSSWAYIDTTGRYAIKETYQFATAFSEGVAAVRQGGKFFFITPSGVKLHGGSFDSASPYIGGKALVKSGDRSFYIDKSGNALAIAQKQTATSIPEGSDTCLVKGVWNNYQGGFVRFSLTNTDTQQWNIAYKNTMTCDGCGQPQLIPGGTAILPDSKSSSSQTQSFIAHFTSGVNGSTSNKTTPHFDMNMATVDGKATITVSNGIMYNAPPPADSSTSWFDFIRSGVDIIKGTLDLADGNIFGGLYDITSGAYDMVSGATGDSANDNRMPFGSGTFYISTLGGTYNNSTMNPVNGNFCGGDSYVISDGSNLVVEMSASRAKSAPGGVNLNFYQYNTFFALQSAKRFNDWRDPSNGTQYLTGDYGRFMAKVFANPSDPTDTTFCQSPDKSQGFMQTVRNTSQFSYNDAYSLFDFANNFNQRCNERADSSVQTSCEYWATKFPYSCSSESFGLNPLILTMGSQTGNTCNWSVTATNTAGPLTSNALSGATFSQGNCSSAQSSCTFNVSASQGTIGQMSISDGWNTVPLGVQCITPMTAMPTAVLGTITPYTLEYEQQVAIYNSLGTVTAVQQPQGVVFSSNTCLGKQSSCTLIVGCNSPVQQATLNISDGVTTLPLQISCQFRER